MSKICERHRGLESPAPEHAAAPSGGSVKFGTTNALPSHSSFCYPAMQTVHHLLLLVLIVTLAGLGNTTKKTEVSMWNVQLVNSQVKTEVRQILCQLLRNKVEILLLPSPSALEKTECKKAKTEKQKGKTECWTEKI